jgi:hypothetical protein
MTEPTYRCGTCDRPVAVVDGTVVRACRCTGAVTASMTATAKGSGALRTG